MTRAILILTTIGAAAALGQTCDCKFGFPMGGATPTIDGVINDAAEYAAAFILDTSLNPACLNLLYDWTGINPVAMNLQAKNVKVLAQRDTANLYIAFRVKDSTQPTASGASGERVFVQIDPDASGGDQLSNGATPSQKDYRFEVAHLWSTAAPGNSLVFSEQNFYRSTLAPGLCGKQRWELVPAGFPAGVQIAGHNDGSGVGGGYSIEMKIPFSAIGLTTVPGNNAIGVSFGILNDLGTPAGDATATSFPATIPINNANSPLADSDLAECQGWLVPSSWGQGFFSAAPTIEIKRDPVWYDSSSILAFNCDADVSNYTYFSIKPCKIRVQAHIENTSQVSQERNILYLWVEPGMGQSNWRFIDLKKNAPIPAGGGDVVSATWAGVPAGLGGHPCVRVYVLPTTFLPGFPESRMTNTSGILDATYINDLEATYKTGATCMAQKNLNEPVAGSCATCPVARLFSSPFTLSAQTLPFPFLIPARESERLTKGKTVAQIEEFGRAAKRARSGKYDFIEPIGGAIQLINPQMIGIPFQLTIGNPERFPQAVFLKTVARDPSNNPVVVNIDFPQGQVLQPHQEKKTPVNVGGKGNKKTCFGKGSASAAVFLMAGLAFLSMRTRRS